jgi:hypothetical protein
VQGDVWHQNQASGILTGTRQLLHSVLLTELAMLTQ